MKRVFLEIGPPGGHLSLRRVGLNQVRMSGSIGWAEVPRKPPREGTRSLGWLGAFPSAQLRRHKSRRLEGVFNDLYEVTRILHFSEKVACGATLMPDSGEPCVLSIAQTGVRVRKSRYGFMGPILYDERNIYLAVKTGMTLAALFPENKIPIPIANPVLGAFTAA
jgi:hypothetical protein